MKKTLSFLLAFVLCIPLFALTACSNKVESEDHFGYKLDYIRKNFPIESLALSTDTPERIVFRNESTQIGFEVVKDKEYCDLIVINATSNKEILKYFTELEKEFNFIDDDDTVIDHMKQDDSYSFEVDGVSIGGSSWGVMLRKFSYDN